MATSQRRLSESPSEVAGMSQMKQPTTSRWNVAKTSQWYASMTSYYWNVIVMTSLKDVTTMSIITSRRRLKQVSNETPNDVSVVRYQDVSVVRIHDVPLARLYDVSCKSQIKHPKPLLWYVSTTSRSYVFVTSC